MPADDQQHVHRLLDVIERGDLFEVIEQIQIQLEPEAAATAFIELAKSLYHQKKSVSEAVAIARAGIQYCLSGSTNPLSRLMLRQKAKVLAFNLAADTWPGWGDPGIVHSASDLDAGRDAARLNLRLVRELERGPLAESKAHWMLGAHLLACGQRREALEEFSLGAEFARVAEDSNNEELNAGYIALIGVLEGDDGARARFGTIVETFANIPDSDDAKFFATQLGKALEVFQHAEARESFRVT